MTLVVTQYQLRTVERFLHDEYGFTDTSSIPQTVTISQSSGAEVPFGQLKHTGPRASGKGCKAEKITRTVSKASIQP